LRCTRLQPVLLAFAVLLPSLRSAHAFERSVGPDGKSPAGWSEPQLELRIGQAMPPGPAGNVVTHAITSAAAAWSFPAIACARTGITFAGATNAQRVISDGVNAVIFRTRFWCRDEIRRRGNCYSPEMVAVTTPHFDEVTGTIREADIEINAVDYDFGVQQTASSKALRRKDAKRIVDLQTVITHELGHVLGFAHPCRSSFAVAKGTAPWCRKVASRSDVSVMMPLALTPVPLVRHALASDDISGVCTVYPRREASSPPPLASSPAAALVASPQTTTSSSALAHRPNDSAAGCSLAPVGAAKRSQRGLMTAILAVVALRLRRGRGMTERRASYQFGLPRR